MLLQRKITVMALSTLLCFAGPVSAQLVSYSVVNTNLSFAAGYAPTGVGAGGQIFGSLAGVTGSDPTGFIYSLANGLQSSSQYIPVSVDRYGNSVGYVGGYSSNATEFFYRSNSGDVQSFNLTNPGAQVSLSGTGMIHQKWTVEIEGNGGYSTFGYAQSIDPESGSQVTTPVGFTPGGTSSFAITLGGRVLAASALDRYSNPTYALIDQSGRQELPLNIRSYAPRIVGNSEGVYAIEEFSSAGPDTTTYDTNDGSITIAYTASYLASLLGVGNVAFNGDSFIGLDDAGRLLSYTTTTDFPSGFVFTDLNRSANCADFSCMARLKDLIEDDSVISYVGFKMGADGTILATGTDGFFYALLPVPEPEQWVLMALGLWLVRVTARAKLRDVTRGVYTPV